MECVANLSEGRDAAVIATMAAAVCSGGARLLDVHSDADHHRSVFTFTSGASESVASAVALARAAVARIDLRAHSGVHPRIGALDVVPFIPLESTMDDCIAAARRAGAAIANETGVPVFLYGQAASDPRHATLAALRRGGLVGLRERIGQPGWVPDFGPAALHPTAGATAVGARAPLVAYNVCLETTDLGVGQEIARACRAAHGGPAGTQALAFFVAGQGCVQVSMNLTSVHPGVVAAAFERVRELAHARGVAVTSSEIVGLAPRTALRGATTHGLLLRDRVEDHVLESRWGRETGFA